MAPGVSTFSPVSVMDSAEAEILYRRGLRSYAIGKIGGAVGLWKQSLRLDPSHVRAQKALNHARREMEAAVAVPPSPGGAQ